MEYTTLGTSGMSVSRIGLGCMSFGSGREWMLDREEGTELIERAIDLGINFFDTANVYSTGESEAILGDALAGYDRDEHVIATKVYAEMDPDNPNSSGLSRKTIEQELEASLDRLGIDTIDLYQTHRWDYDTPIDETLRALDDAVRRGSVRYIGTSSMWAHQFAEALQTSEALNLERFATMQNHYNAFYREEEREMLPLCEKEGIGVIPWSPLARGVGTRPHDELDTTTRGQTDQYLEQIPYLQGGGEEINERIQELAAQKGVTMAQISLAWLLHKEWVDVPIVGTTSVDHLEEAVEAIELDLSDSDLAYLEEPYEPLPIAGHE
ncbi:aldo/keto reductase [Natronorubrum sp. JWXQ-INN-674]|uniref:Aldo/keto reductase n=1 Tax=Natronorubrum halalkaliphilum TaxID=2691917 RepID=A0A6B0VRJ6_9EURY|nr:aldo/keto reductase [Natronorubrum halalkaliphilum]MXV63412.1 aldo/keto reductase [Natronorubrum halalkaliphilum]